MRRCGLRLTLLAAFGVCLLGSGGVSAAPVACSDCIASGVGDEGHAVDPNVPGGDYWSHDHDHMKRGNDEDIDWETWTPYKPPYNWTDSPWSAAGVAESKRNNTGPPPDKLGGKISDELFNDIIITAIMASFTPRDKLKLRTRPKKAWKNMLSMTERRIRGVMAGMEKQERRAVLRGALNNTEKKYLTDDLPELVQDSVVPRNRQKCKPRDDMATCIVGIWVLGVLGVPGEEVITTRGGAWSKLKVAPSLEIFKFMGQRDPDNGFWRSWYDIEKKRISGLPPNEAEVTSNFASVLKDAMVRGKGDGVDLETDREFRLNRLPDPEKDGVARFISMLWHRGEHLKAGRAEKKRQMVQEVSSERDR